ncbi:MAG: hypothetical protein U1G08_13865 [Verrucomicrobiota bacterium]
MKTGTGRIDPAPVTGFQRYIGIDYSGAGSASQGLPGVRVYEANRDRSPREVSPVSGSRRHWTRQGLALWLTETLQKESPCVVGMDHGFSFPIRYFEMHRIPADWSRFLEDFHRHWPTDHDGVRVDDVRRGRIGHGNARGGNSRWRRRTEERCGAKSVFHFDVPGSVAKSTHAGLPCLRFLRQALGIRLHFWPFDGWQPTPGRSVLAEAYPSLYNAAYPVQDRNPDQHDAYSIARWLQESDSDGTLKRGFQPTLDPEERAIAAVEGWILGLPGTALPGQRSPHRLEALHATSKTL